MLQNHHNALGTALPTWTDILVQYLAKEPQIFVSHFSGHILLTVSHVKGSQCTFPRLLFDIFGTQGCIQNCQL